MKDALSVMTVRSFVTATEEKARQSHTGLLPDMRILITGGAGFLGSHVSEALIYQGHQVICMDNLCTGSVRNIRHLLEDDAFTFIKYDVCNYIHVDGHLDAVMHCASPASHAWRCNQQYSSSHQYR